MNVDDGSENGPGDDDDDDDGVDDSRMTLKRMQTLDRVDPDAGGTKTVSSWEPSSSSFSPAHPLSSPHLRSRKSEAGH